MSFIEALFFVLSSPFKRKKKEIEEGERVSPLRQNIDARKTRALWRAINGESGEEAYNSADVLHRFAAYYLRLGYLDHLMEQIIVEMIDGGSYNEARRMIIRYASRRVCFGGKKILFWRHNPSLYAAGCFTFPQIIHIVFLGFVFGKKLVKIGAYGK